MAYVILPHTPLLELDQGQVIGSTLGWQSLVDSLSYRYCLLLSLFIKLQQYHSAQLGLI